MLACEDLGIFGTKESETWPWDLDKLRGIVGRVGESCDNGHFWSDSLSVNALELRHLLVDAFLEEPLRFNGLAVATTDEYTGYEGKSYQAIVKRCRGDDATLLLVAIIGASYECLRHALDAFCRKDNCNTTGVAAITIVNGVAHFHIYNPTKESLTVIKCGPPQGVSIISFVRSKLDTVKDRCVENHVKKIAGEIKFIMTGEHEVDTGFSQRILRQLRGIV
ncbi:hypothetical protein SCHPADRAFT_39518 [Schizopora paradoxa]|uniref:Uncharacterized protein n=1 Tax=Schizopora paradoxa TaxID=27342 RepID=A0A0H2S700_9AGAM|nr:hypothetical protein SCHPADRAFT_39518 [Schizopora paradoxa]